MEIYDRNGERIMKKVIQGTKLEEKMLEAVHLLCDTTAVTLGPSGVNVLVDTKDEPPFITNDGVTIAKNIESEDPTVNAILEIAKEASLKTNEIVGDGTTTTLVLLKELYLLGLNLLKMGKNSQTIQKEWHKDLTNIIAEIKKYSHLPTEEELQNIAAISANDRILGTLVAEAFNKVKKRSSIRLKESSDEKTFYELLNGYTLDTSVSYEYFINNEEKIEVNQPKIYLFKNKVETIEQISPLINKVIDDKKELILVLPDISKEVKEQCISFHYQKICTMYCICIPEYAERIIDIRKDLEACLGIESIDLYQDRIDYTDYEATISGVTLTKETTTFFFQKYPYERIIKLEKELEETKSEYQKEYLAERLAKLTTGLCNFYIGGYTKVEKKERLMRAEDALWAIDIAKQGVITGEGVILAKIKQDHIEENSIYQVLDNPLKQILNNAGVDDNKISEKLFQDKEAKIYDVELEKIIPAKESTILDATLVTITALKNAISIALMLLSTQYLVINEEKEIKEIEI